MRHLIDTNVWIDALSGMLPASAFLKFSVQASWAGYSAICLYKGRHPGSGNLPESLCRGGLCSATGGTGFGARSLEDPILTNETNISGFLNMLAAARDEKVRRFKLNLWGSPGVAQAGKSK